MSFTSKTGKVKVLVAQSYPTFCNPMDCNPPGFSVHGILNLSRSEGRTEVVRLERRSSLESAEGEGEVGMKVN